jgi:phage/plasmid-associated DNA primase
MQVDVIATEFVSLKRSADMMEPEPECHELSGAPEPEKKRASKPRLPKLPPVPKAPRVKKALPPLTTYRKDELLFAGQIPSTHCPDKYVYIADAGAGFASSCQKIEELEQRVSEAYAAGNPLAYYEYNTFGYRTKPAKDDKEAFYNFVNVDRANIGFKFATRLRTKLFVDYENKDDDAFSEHANQFHLKQVQSIVDTICTKLNVTRDVISIQTACGMCEDKYKYSYHIVLTDKVIFSTCDALGDWIKENLGVAAVDMSVYSAGRKFRPLFCTKPDENRPLVPFDATSAAIPWRNTLTNYTGNVDMGSALIIGIVPDAVELKRLHVASKEKKKPGPKTATECPDADAVTFPEMPSVVHYMHEAAMLYLLALDPSIYEDRDQFIKIGLIMKGLGMTFEHWERVHAAYLTTKDLSLRVVDQAKWDGLHADEKSTSLGPFMSFCKQHGGPYGALTFDDAGNPSVTGIRRFWKKLYSHNFAVGGTNVYVYSETTGRWSVDEGNAKLSYSMEELHYFFTDMTRKFAKLAFNIRSLRTAVEMKLTEDNIPKEKRDEILQHFSVYNCDDLIDHIKYYSTKGDTSLGSVLFDGLKTYCQERNVLDQMHPHEHLFACNNGVVDLRDGSFRIPVREDFITQFSPVDYNPHVDQEKLAFLHSKLDQIMPDPAVKLYVLRLLAAALWRHNFCQRLHIFTGGGGNGKGLLMRLLQKIFGNQSTGYYATLPSGLYTEKDFNPTKPRSELVPLRTCQLAVVPDLNDADNLELSFAKNITGRDDLAIRDLYEKSVDVKAKCYEGQSIICTNHIPQIKRIDQSVIRRLVIIQFLSQFYDPFKPYDVERFAGKPNCYPVDRDLESKFADVQIQQTFLWILVNLWKTEPRMVKDLPTPDAIAQNTLCYFNDNCPYATWIRDNFDPCVGARLTKDIAVRAVYNFTMREIRPKPQFEKVFAKYVGPMSRGLFQTEIVEDSAGKPVTFIVGYKLKPAIEESGDFWNSTSYDMRPRQSPETWRFNYEHGFF